MLSARPEITMATKMRLEPPTKVNDRVLVQYREYNTRVIYVLTIICIAFVEGLYHGD